MRHKFYIPIGFPSLPAPPSTDPYDLRDGDTYWDTALKQLRTWDATNSKWVSGGGTLTAGAGLSSSSTSLSDDIEIHVNHGLGINIVNDAVAVNRAVTDGWYVRKTGDLMSGPLSLPLANPTSNIHAAHKAYVDSRVNTTAAYTIGGGNGLTVTAGGVIGSNPVLNVGKGTGILVSPDAVALDTAYTNSLYSRTTHTHSNYAPVHTHPYAPTSHTHAYTQVGIWAGSTNVGTLVGGQTKTIVVQHNLNRTIRAASVTPYGDSGSGTTGGDLSLVASIREKITDNKNLISVMVKNLNASASEDGVGVSVIIIY